MNEQDELPGRADLRAAAEIIKGAGIISPPADFTDQVMARVRPKAERTGSRPWAGLLRGYTWADCAAGFMLVGLFNLILGLVLVYGLMNGPGFQIGRPWAVWSLGTAGFFLVLGLFLWAGRGRRSRLATLFLLLYAAAALVYGLTAQTAYGPAAGLTARAVYTLATLSLAGVLTFFIQAAAGKRLEPGQGGL